MFLGPRQKRAQKRHRGGGGLAVLGPFKRIARAGGQKVTIQTAQRPFFELSSPSGEHSLIFFRHSRNEQRYLSNWRKNWQINAIAAELPIQRRPQLFGQAADDPFELDFARTFFVVRNEHGAAEDEPGGEFAGSSEG